MNRKWLSVNVLHICMVHLGYFEKIKDSVLVPVKKGVIPDKDTLVYVQQGVIDEIGECWPLLYLCTFKKEKLGKGKGNNWVLLQLSHS